MSSLIKPLSAEESPIVSFDSDELILVNEQDQEQGFLSKDKCHDGQGVLHRAFSVFVFDSSGRLLLQQRSDSKRLWPLYWSNTCCSHPRRSESMEDATRRRLQQELGFHCDLDFLYKFQYQAHYQDLGSEYEVCWVYTGRCDAKVVPNENEVAQSRWLLPAQIDAELQSDPGNFTPWFKLEWARVRNQVIAFVP